MRVLYFTRDYTPHDYRFLAALAGTDHRVFYLRLERRGQQLEDRSLPSQIEQVPWSGGRARARLRDAPRLLAGLRNVIRNVEPDLIHAGPIQTSAFLAALSGFRPLVSMSWGSDLLRDAGHSAAYRWATRYTLSNSDALIVDCDPVRQKALEFGIPEPKIVSFPWGVDLDHFSPANARPALFDREAQDGHERSFTLLSTRGWEPNYGVDVIARAFVQAARQRPELRLIMLGGGSQAGLLHEIFTRGGIQEQVLLPGQVSQEDLPRYYRASDLYVSASHSDGTSISLLEAMASGTPCLVSDIPGNREWIEPEVQGWWFPDGDAGALAHSVLAALQARDRLAEMGRAARRTAEQRADWDENFRKLLQAYEMARRARR